MFENGKGSDNKDVLTGFRRHPHFQTCALSGLGF